MEVVHGDTYDLRSLLSSEERDFLVRHNGDQVKIGELDGKIVGLYFSAHWCGPYRQFTPKLADVYEELSTNGGFEVVFVSADTDEESFKKYFGSMPWLAVPFSDSTVRYNLYTLFKVQGTPHHLVILDGNGKLLTKDGVRVIGDYCAEGYPFTTGRMEAARKAQNLASILVSGERDFVISNDGKKVYQELKDKGASFEVVLISLDSDENSFKEQFQAMPWFALPFNDKACAKLPCYFELNSLPTLVIIGTDGKTLNPNVAELIENHGINAYPFSPEKLAELTELEKRRLASRTLESPLVTSKRDFVIGGGGVKAEEKKKKSNEEEEEKKKNANEEDGEKKNAKEDEENKNANEEDEENKNANEEDGEKKNDNEDEEQKKANEEDGKDGDHEQDGQKEGYVRAKLVLKLKFPTFFFLALLERRW